jgi:hypothetical protein
MEHFHPQKIQVSTTKHLPTEALGWFWRQRLCGLHRLLHRVQKPIDRGIAGARIWLLYRASLHRLIKGNTESFSWQGSDFPITLYEIRHKLLCHARLPS